MKKLIASLFFFATLVSAEPRIAFGSWVEWGDYVYALLNGDDMATIWGLKIKGKILDSRFTPVSVEETPVLRIAGMKEIQSHFPNDGEYIVFIGTAMSVVSQFRNMPTDPALQKPEDISYNEQFRSQVNLPVPTQTIAILVFRRSSQSVRPHAGIHQVESVEGAILPTATSPSLHTRLDTVYAADTKGTDAILAYWELMRAGQLVTPTRNPLKRVGRGIVNKIHPPAVFHTAGLRFEISGFNKVLERWSKTGEIAPPRYPPKG